MVARKVIHEHDGPDANGCAEGNVSPHQQQQQQQHHHHHHHYHHQYDGVEMSQKEAVSKEPSIESQLSEGSSMTGDPVMAASPSRSLSSDHFDEKPTESCLPIANAAAGSAVGGGGGVVVVDRVHGRGEEDGLEHAQAVASTLVAQLVEDEDHSKEEEEPPMANHHISGTDQWLYR